MTGLNVIIADFDVIVCDDFDVLAGFVDLAIGDVTGLNVIVAYFDVTVCDDFDVIVHFVLDFGVVGLDVADFESTEKPGFTC